MVLASNTNQSSPTINDHKKIFSQNIQPSQKNELKKNSSQNLNSLAKENKRYQHQSNSIPTIDVKKVQVVAPKMNKSTRPKEFSYEKVLFA
jgi:hypothetical protein